jgi:hypothetical protein
VTRKEPELGDGQYVEGTPQAGAGAAVGKCGEVSQTPTLRVILERKKDQGGAKQSHSSGTEMESYRATGVATMGKLFAAPSGWVRGNAGKNPN